MNVKKTNKENVINDFFLNIRIMRLITWVNILTQMFLPLAGVFTPAIVNASENIFLSKPDGEIKVKPYVLLSGETTEIVAKKYNISVQELKKLNQFRVFSRGFEHLRAGDELDVPLSPLPTVQWTKKDEAGNDNINSSAQKAASLASQFGTFLSNNPTGKDAASLATSTITGKTNSGIQQWLSQFGTARVDIDIDDKFSLENSQLDLLVPIWESKDRLLFSQGSIHRTEGRTQSNFGLGFRHFTNGSMIGINTFLDYDLSRDHSRGGIGLEYGQDFLTLSANSYFHLSDWKYSDDLEDYEERPADGWDIRAEGYLPAYPQLGGKLMWEKYYGENVALFDTDDLQKNPHAITAGINWTPFTLLTFGAERRQGQSGNNENKLTLQVNYQTGSTLRDQLDPESVANYRRLAGHRYDLVSRNNDIILNYHKKQVISLSISPLITGYAGQKKSLNVSVNSKYGVKKINFTAPLLLANGGKIISDGGYNYSVVLPPYQSGGQNVNNYTIDAIAIDNKGNTSSKVESQVSVLQAAISPTNSALTPRAALLPADGKSLQTLVLSIQDAHGNPIDIPENEISAATNTQGKGNAQVSKFKREDAGKYSATVTAGLQPEYLTVTPVVRNTTFPSTKIVVKPDTTTSRIASFSVTADNAIANGKAENYVKAVIEDAEGNHVPNSLVTFSASNGAVIPVSSKTNLSGEVSVPVTSLYAGSSTIIAKSIDGAAKNAIVTFVPDTSTAQITNDHLSIMPKSSVADGRTPKRVKAVVTDTHGNTVPDMKVIFSANNGAVISQPEVTSDNNGVAVTLMTSSVSGNSTVTAQVNKNKTTQATIFTANTSTAVLTKVVAKPGTHIADGNTPVTFSAVVKDAYGNPLANIPVDWQSDRDNSQVKFSEVQSLTNDKGVASTSLTSTQAYNVTVTAFANGSSLSAKPIAFVADAQNAVISEFTSNHQEFIANGKNRVDLVAKIEDSHGNPLPDAVVDWTSDNGSVITPLSATTTNKGLARAIVSTTKAGGFKVRVALQNGQYKDISLTALADPQTATIAIVSSANEFTAGDSNGVTLTATVVDAQGNPVQGTTVSWRSSGNVLSQNIGSTDSKGQVRVSLTGTKAGITTVTGQLYNGHETSDNITVKPGSPVQVNSRFVVRPQSITADGVSIATTSLVLRDTWNNLVPGQSVKYSTNGGGIQFSNQQTKVNGIYQSNITGNSEGTWNLTASTGGVNLSVPVGLIANQHTALIDTVTVRGSATANANGQDTVIIRAKVKDSQGNTNLPGVSVGWQTTLGTLSAPISTTNGNGVAEITISSLKAGQATVSAIVGGGSPVPADKTIAFTAGTVSVDRSAVGITPSSIIAGKGKARLRIVLRDNNGNILRGLADKITVSDSPELNVTSTPFSEVAPGVYESDLTGTKAGTTQISAAVEGTPLTQTGSLNVTADETTAHVSGQIGVSSPTAIVGQSITYTATLVDQNDNALGAGIPVTWQANNGSTLSTQVSQTDSYGQATVNVSRSQAGIATVSVVSPGTPIAAPDVVFNAGEPDESKSALTLVPGTITAGIGKANLTLILRDKEGNLLTGQQVKGKSDNTSVSMGNAQEKAAGIYNINVTGDSAGTANLSVTVNGSAFGPQKILTISGDTSSWSVQSITANTASVTAGDTTGVTYSATVVDKYGNPLPDVIVGWHLDGQAESYNYTSQTNSKGIATSTVKSNTAGQLVMTAALDDTHTLSASPVTVIPAAIDDAKSTFSADKTLIGSDGQETSTLTVKLSDSFDNRISGKTVTVSGSSSLPGFSVNPDPMTDSGNGIYLAQATSTEKGEVSLTANVDGQVIGKPIKITVGAITPALTFANTTQEVVYTSSFTKSQSVQGSPDGVTQMWSSSAPEVATVDQHTGVVTLLKSGTAVITVQTSSNAQYTAASAHYTLVVDKASPQLTAQQPSLSATWDDGSSQNVNATIDNSDAASLPIRYSSSDESIVTVDKKGLLTQVKPGTAEIDITTPETDQFTAGSQIVTYVLAKAVPYIQFAEATQQVTTEDKPTVQQPTLALSDQENATWSSSNPDAVTVTPDGKITKIAPGQAQISLTVNANEYYEQGSGSYSMEVYGQPSISQTITHYSQGVQDTDTTVWQPTITSDKLNVSWTSQTSDKYTSPTKVIIQLLDGGNELSSKTETVNFTNQVATFTASKDYWGKSLTVKATAYGIKSLSSSQTSPAIATSAVTLDQLISSVQLTSNSEAHWHYGGGWTDYCRTTYPGGETDVWAVFKQLSLTLKNSGELLDPVTLALRVSYSTEKNGQELDDKKGTDKDVLTQSFSKTQSNSLVSKNYTISLDCWQDYDGQYTPNILATYNGKSKTYTGKARQWKGRGGGMNEPYIDNMQ